MVGSGDGEGRVAVAGCGLTVWVGISLGIGLWVGIVVVVGSGVEMAQPASMTAKRSKDTRINTAAPEIANKSVIA